MSEIAQKSKRILSVDVLRGITIVFMILIDDPAGKKFEFMCHPIWMGLTLADFVFPTFITLVGVSMYFSLKKYDFKPCKQSIFRVVRRFILLMLFGWVVVMVAHGFSAAFAGKDWVLTAFDFANMRILGVIPRIAICYFIGALIILLVRNKKVIIGIIAAILIGYCILLIAGNGFDFNDTNNILSTIDQSVLGREHMYKMAIDEQGTATIFFDPEGLASTIPCVAQVLLGFLIGGIICDKKKDNNAKVMYMFIVGFSLLALGFIFSPAVPIFKKAWTSTFVLVTVGSDACLLALLTWIIDIKGHKKWTTFFRVYGSNAIISFAAMDIIWVILAGLKLTKLAYNFFLPICCGVTGLASVLTTGLFVLAWYVVLYLLDKKKIYIRL
ncbi:MAG: DUF5009 domain-containing protein [Coriobacteriia bacterium]|nr:DUF5009 domain-containing protein [Coriobacteriia bacterium]